MAAISQLKMYAPASTIWARHRLLITGFVVTLVGALLRLYRFDANGFNTDEVWTTWMARLSAPDILEVAFSRQDGPPPLYYLILHALECVGADPMSYRLLSVLFGSAAVLLTFRFGTYLYDWRIGALGAFLLAISPEHIAYSQVARTYVPAALLALMSLYCFAHIFCGDARRRHWIGFVAATAMSGWLFFVTLALLPLYNVLMIGHWLRTASPRSTFVPWLVSQSTIAALLLPVLVYVPLSAIGWSTNHGRWLEPPGLAALAKTMILFGTGDPSYGPTGMTVARGLSLLVVGGVAILGLRDAISRLWSRPLDEHGRRLLLLGGTCFVPWAAVFALSQWIPFYSEKYLLFLAPSMLTFVAYVVLYAPQRTVARVVLSGLIVLTIVSLSVFYTEPFGEQWREAAALVRARHQPGDAVIISPAFYARPFGFYFGGTIPEGIELFEGERASIYEDGRVTPVAVPGCPAGPMALMQIPAVPTEHRLWLVSGYAPIGECVARWMEQETRVLENNEFSGAHVRLLMPYNAVEEPASTAPGE